MGISCQSSLSHKKKFINSSPNVCIILYDIAVMSILSSGVDHYM